MNWGFLDMNCIIRAADQYRARFSTGKGDAAGLLETTFIRDLNLAVHPTKVSIHYHHPFFEL